MSYGKSPSSYSAYLGHSILQACSGIKYFIWCDTILSMIKRVIIMPPDSKNQKRTPYAALLWSAMLPGFGQMYNRDFIVGAVLIILEFGTNILAKLNYAIIHSFNFSSQVNELTDANFQWMLFYPGIWSYSMWQAYNKAREINSVIEKGGEVTTKFTGLFVGLTVFMQLGVIWPVLHSPILTGIIFGSFGAVIGNFCEKYWTAGQQFNGK